MNYQEKVALAEKGYELLKKGQSSQAVKSYLTEKGVKSYELDKINFSMSKMAYIEYKDDIKRWLLSEHDALESTSPLSCFDSSFLQTLTDKGIQDIRSESKREVNRLLAEGMTEEEVISAVVNRRYPKELALEHIQFYKDFIALPDTEERVGGSLIGGALILGGLLLFILLVTGKVNGGRILDKAAIFLMILGGVLVYRANVPKGIANQKNENWL